MAIQKKYLKSAGDIIPTYDYYDFAEGTGTKIFYGCAVENSGAYTYCLKAEKIASAKSVVNLVDHGSVTTNFDLSAFNYPKYVKGTAYLSFCMGGANNILMHMNSQIFKVDAEGAETPISENFWAGTFTATAALPSKMTAIKFPLTPTGFKKGDALRLKMIFTQENATNGSEYGCDPENRESTNGWVDTAINSSILQLHIPFRLDV